MLFKDRVFESSTTTGTGNVTLAGNLTGYQTFNTAYGIATTNTFYYTIQEVDGSGNPTGQWECGIGFLSAATTLVRSIILSNSSGTTSAITLGAGTKYVFSDGAVADKIGPQLTKLHLNTGISIANNSATNIIWDTKDRDDVGAWASTPNPTRITVPTGYTLLRLTGYAVWAANSTGVRNLEIVKNASNYGPGNARAASAESAGQVVSDWMTVVAGDYFELQVFQTSTVGLTLAGDASANVFGRGAFFQAEWLR